MKRGKPPRRRTPLRPGTKRLTTRKRLEQKVPVKARNHKRHAKQQAKAYGGEYGEWIRQQRCCACGARPPSVRAHAGKTQGAGGKAEHLVPLCWSCEHERLHQWGIETFERWCGRNMLEEAAKHRARWELLQSSRR